MPSSQTPAMKKKLKEEKSVSSGACLWKEIKILSKWNLKTARSQVAGKVVPPLTERTTVQSSSEEPEIPTELLKHRKSSLLSSGTETNPYFFKWRKKKKPQKTDHISLPRDARFFLLQMPPSRVVIPRCPEHKSHLMTLTWSIQAECSDCKCQHISITAAQLLLSVLPEPLCLHFPTHSKGFLLCMRDRQV